jgi:hypothetical protein
MARRTVAIILVFCALIMMSTLQPVAAKQRPRKPWPQKPRPPYYWLWPPGGYPVIHPECCGKFQQTEDSCLREIFVALATKKATLQTITEFCAQKQVVEGLGSRSPPPM